MAEHIHNFSGGMDRDTSAFKYPKNKYFEANNMRLVVDEETQQFSLTTIDGNELSFTTTNYFYRGHCFVRNQLVLFLEHVTGSTDLIVEVDPLSPNGVGNELDYSNTVFSGDLGLDQHTNYISTTSIYETADIRKVYFSDNTNPIRVINLDRDYSGFAADDLNLLPPLEHDGIEYTLIEESGRLNSGMVQYAYKLYSENGSETYFSQLSTILPITKGTVSSPTNYRDTFKGGIKEQTCNKSVKFEIDTAVDADKFDYIQVVGIYYVDKDIDPSIKVLGDFPFSSNVLEFIDTGSGYSGEYTVAEFNALRLVFAAASIENKSNHLIAANTEEEIFDVDFDARAYRFANSGSAEGQAKLFESDGSYFIVCRAGITRPGAGGTAALGDWVYYNSSDVYQASHTDYDQSGYGTGFGIPENSDAICPENYLTEDFTPGTYVQENRYFYVGETYGTLGKVGGQGLNVSYQIRADSIQEEVNDDSTTITSQYVGGGSNGYQRRYQNETGGMSVSTSPYMLGTLDNYASPIRASVDRSFQRDEIYRVGLIFIDKFGRSSYVKWVGDVRMPKVFDVYDNGISGTLGFYLTEAESGAPDKYMVNRVVLDVEVENVSDPNVVGFQVVTVERTLANSTVLDSGWMGSLEFVQPAYDPAYNITGFTFPTSLASSAFGTAALAINTEVGVAGGLNTDDSNLSTNHKEYISPDINFSNGDVSNSATKFICYATGNSTVSRYAYHANSSMLLNTSYFKQYGTEANSFYSLSYYAEFDIEEFAIFSDQTYNAGNDTSAYAYNLGGGSVYNYSKGGASYDTSSNAGAKGSCGIVYGTEGSYYGAESPFDATAVAGVEAIYVSRKNTTEPYGGLSYESRKISAYSPSSPFAEIIAGDGDVQATGDTYVGIFEHLRTMVSDNDDINDGDNNIEVLYLPVESRYNVVARSNNCVYNQAIAGVLTSKLGIKETPGAWLYEAGGSEYFAQDYYLYDYNNTYNRVSNIQKFYEAPLGYTVGDVSRYDTKIVASEEKEGGELIDSWSIFLFANELELKTEYGPITAIDIIGGDLISLQEKATASVAINDREQITGDSGSGLTLGSGGILERYDYISTTTGCQSPKGYVVSPTGLYFFDADNNGIYGLTVKGEPSLSKVTFMDSFFKDMYRTGYSLVCAGYDRSHNDVLFTFDIGVNQRTLAFNESRGYFTHFLDTDRYSYIYDDRVLMSGDSNNSSTFYLENVQDSLTIDGAAFDCSVTTISRPEHPALSRFDYMEWNSIVKTIPTGAEEVDVTFDTIEAENTYQSTGSLTSTLFKRRMRDWRLNSIRDNSTIRGALRPRIRSEWLKTTFTFTPSTNKIWIDTIKAIFQPNKV